MNHCIAAGHFDPHFVQRGKLVKTSDLDATVVRALLAECASVNAAGQYTLAGYPVVWNGSYLVCPWLVPYPLLEAIDLLRQLHMRTGCLLTDVGSREVVDVGDLLPAEHPLSIASQQG